MIPANKKGFVLIEMVVSVGIFAVVMMVGMGALLNIVDANKKAQSVQLALDNLNFAMENMSRVIRTGSYYHCGGSGNLEDPVDCTEGSSVFAFEERNGERSDLSDQVVYRLRNNQIEKSNNGGASFFGITAPNITIESLKFYVVGALVSDTIQPRVLIAIKGSTSGGVRKGTTFSVQTTVSQRVFNF